MERGNGGGVVGRGGRGAFRGKGCRERGGSGSQFLRRADSCTRASLNVKRRLQRRLHTYHSILQYINPQHIILHIHGPHTMRITHDAYHPPHGKTHTKTCCRAAISCTSAGPRERIAFCSHRFRVYGFGIKSAHVLLSFHGAGGAPHEAQELAAVPARRPAACRGMPATRARGRERPEGPAAPRPCRWQATHTMPLGTDTRAPGARMGLRRFLSHVLSSRPTGLTIPHHARPPHQNAQGSRT